MHNLQNNIIAIRNEYLEMNLFCVYISTELYHEIKDGLVNLQQNSIKFIGGTRGKGHLSPLISPPAKRRFSLARINAYKALSSPSLIALSSKDPILTGKKEQKLKKTIQRFNLGVLGRLWDMSYQRARRH